MVAEIRTFCLYIDGPELGDEVGFGDGAFARIGDLGFECLHCFGKQLLEVFRAGFSRMGRHKLAFIAKTDARCYVCELTLTSEIPPFQGFLTSDESVEAIKGCLVETERSRFDQREKLSCSGGKVENLQFISQLVTANRHPVQKRFDFGKGERVPFEGTRVKYELREHLFVAKNRALNGCRHTSRNR